MSTAEDRLAALEAEHRALAMDYRAIQAAFLDLLTRTQRLEADLERRTFGRAVADLVPHRRAEEPLFENPTDRCGRQA